MTISSVSPATPIQILLVDDQPALLWGLELLINGESPRMAVVGKAMERTTALKLVAQTQPDVVLLDLDLAGELSLDFLPELLCLSSARVLVFTGINDPGLHARALQDGACGVVRKEENADVLLRAITRAHQSRAVARIGESARPLGGGGAAGL